LDFDDHFDVSTTSVPKRIAGVGVIMLVMAGASSFYISSFPVAQAGGQTNVASTISRRAANPPQELDEVPGSLALSDDKETTARETEAAIAVASPANSTVSIKPSKPTNDQVDDGFSTPFSAEVTAEVTNETPTAPTRIASIPVTTIAISKSYWEATGLTPATYATNAAGVSVISFELLYRSTSAEPVTIDLYLGEATSPEASWLRLQANATPVVGSQSQSFQVPTSMLAGLGTTINVASIRITSTLDPSHQMTQGPMQLDAPPPTTAAPTVPPTVVGANPLTPTPAGQASPLQPEARVEATTSTIASTTTTPATTTSTTLSM
jgi:hypothetical protein